MNRQNRRRIAQAFYAKYSPYMCFETFSVFWNFFQRTDYRTYENYLMLPGVDVRVLEEASKAAWALIS